MDNLDARRELKTLWMQVNQENTQIFYSERMNMYVILDSSAGGPTVEQNPAIRPVLPSFKLRAYKQARERSSPEEGGEARGYGGLSGGTGLGVFEENKREPEGMHLSNGTVSGGRATRSARWGSEARRSLSKPEVPQTWRPLDTIETIYIFLLVKDIIFGLLMREGAGQRDSALSAADAGGGAASGRGKIRGEPLNEGWTTPIGGKNKRGNKREARGDVFIRWHGPGGRRGGGGGGGGSRRPRRGVTEYHVFNTTRGVWCREVVSEGTGLGVFEAEGMYLFNGTVSGGREGEESAGVVYWEFIVTHSYGDSSYLWWCKGLVQRVRGDWTGLGVFEAEWVWSGNCTVQ
ncbi:hypothetical protein C8R44DRAFT_735461 [Mycena epipterygia]|nr:hypothetical protein C8R44DRAFT_735461 [Mycena epipterygia]